MTEWNPHNPYDLGIWSELEMTPPSMPDLTEPIDIKLPIPCDSPPRKKPRPSLSLRKNTDKEDSRFVSPSKKLESYQRGYVPKNTDVNTSWAVRNFEDWKRAYNERHPESPCPDEVLFTGNVDILSHWMQKYALGTRKKNREKYPPKTVCYLLSGLNRYMKEKKTDSFNIFYQTNNSFKMLRRTCDSLFRELRQEGVGSSSKSTEPITKDEEQLLWSSGQLDPSTPRGLLNAVFFLHGKNFVLRGGTEHRDLKISQIARNVSPEGKERYTYTERCSKNRAGGFCYETAMHTKSTKDLPLVL